MAAVAKTKDDILNIIKEKKDKDRMKVLMESAGNVATWNADQFLRWPKVNNKGKVLAIVIMTEPESVKSIQGKHRNDKDKTAGKIGEIQFTINGLQIVKFRASENLKYATSAFSRGTQSVSAHLRTKLQEKGSALVFDLAINKDRVFDKWQDLKYKYNGEAYNGLKKIWKDDASLDDVESEWMINFYKQHKALLPRVGSNKFHSVNRDGGFMEFIEQFVIDEFGHILKGGGGGKAQKDNWNPADIWLVNDEDKIIEHIKKEIGSSIYGSGNKQSTASAEIQLRQLNYIMRQLFKQKKLMGISLKKVDGKTAKYVEVNVSTKFLEKVSQISKMGSYQLGQTGQEQPLCNMDVKEGKRNNQWVWDSDDCRIRVRARSKLYDFQIKRNVTSSSKLSYDNLKFEPTEQGKGGARMGKAATFLVEELLHNEGVPFKNDKNDPKYPKTYELFDERQEQDYKNKLENIKRAGVDIGVSVEDAITNLKLVFQEGNAPDAANSKLMQITFMDTIMSASMDKRNKIATDLVFMAGKMGARFGPHGKIY